LKIPDTGLTGRFTPMTLLGTVNASSTSKL
jgi:hypothetical protein